MDVLKPKISVVSPVYRGEKMVQQLVDRNVAVLDGMTRDNLIGGYELILVNDSSPDKSWEIIKSVCVNNCNIKGVNLSRNYGQECAIKAGLSKVSGDWIIVMDCDLQDRPEEIPILFAKAQEGYDVVRAQRINRRDGFCKKMSSTIFHKVFNFLSGSFTDKTIGNFGIYCRKIINEYIKIPELATDFVLLIPVLGFRETAIPVRHDVRAEGKSSYSLIKLLKNAFSSILCNTNKPLRLIAYLGIFMSIVSFILAVYNVLAKLLGIVSVDGYTTTIFSIWFVGGLLMAQLGVLGLYIGKVFDQVKGRPAFIIMDELNFVE